MKRISLATCLIAGGFSLCAFLMSACSDSSIENKELSEFSVITPNVPKYFWGTWQRMDNGESYFISDSAVSKSNKTFKVTSSTKTSLSVAGLGTFTKQSDNVMINDNIPYFRDGGTNLEFKVKLVGFESAGSRSAARAPSAVEIYKESKDFSSANEAVKPNSDGTATLHSAVSGDNLTLTVTDGRNPLAVVPGFRVYNNGSNMGTIYIPKAGEYSLKVTGKIDKTDDGYLYADKKYKMILTITNVSDVKSETSVCKITPEDSRVSVTVTKGTTQIPTILPGLTNEIELSLICAKLSENEESIDTGLKISIENTRVKKTWEDYVPLKIYKGTVPVTITAKTTITNSKARLNGFIIYPDKNIKFFKVNEGGTQTLFVPTFGSKEHTLAFCGATIDGKLSNSTEMLYTVAPGSRVKKNINGSDEAFIIATRYGEENGGNETEDTAKKVNEAFEAYLSEGEIDYYKMSMPAEIDFSNSVYNVEDLSDLDMTKFDYGKSLKIIGNIKNNILSAVSTKIKKATQSIVLDLSETTGLEELKASAFSGCSKLASITFPDSVTAIGSSAFSGCTELTSITIPKRVTKIGKNAFDKCEKLTSVEFEDSSAEWKCTSKNGTSTVSVNNKTVNVINLKTTYCAFDWEKGAN